MLITVKITDHSPGPPYYPVLRGTGLYKSEIKVQGKQYYLQAMDHPCSRTWISNEDAAKFLDEFVRT